MLPQNIFSRNFWTSSIKFIAKIAISLHWYSAEKPTSEGLGREERRKVSRGYQHFFSIFPKYPLCGGWWLGIVLIRSDDGFWWIHYGDDGMITHIPGHHQHCHGPGSRDWSSGHHPSSHQQDDPSLPSLATLPWLIYTQLAPLITSERSDIIAPWCNEELGLSWCHKAARDVHHGFSSPEQTGGNSFSGWC